MPVMLGYAFPYLDIAHYFRHAVSYDIMSLSDSQQNQHISKEKINFFLGGVNLIDCVQIYGKTKEAFEWPEDQVGSLLNLIYS